MHLVSSLYDEDSHFSLGFYLQLNRRILTPERVGSNKRVACRRVSAILIQEAGNTTPASSTDHKRKGAYALSKKRFKVALGCMAIRTQTELMIRRVQFIRRTKEARTQAACTGNSRGYYSKYGNSWFNNRENDDSYYMFRSYNHCYYSSSEAVTDEEDEL